VAHVALPNHRVLTHREIDTIVRWVDQGALEGNPNDAPEPVFPYEWTWALRR
jgi:hypothetical protein